jgi:crotonobetainyl-CoA:carnitine CoA-transferase CaiB-like acyl-CoA transferase
VFESEQVKARKSLVEIDDPDVGTNQFARGPVMLSGSPEIETNPAPDLGEHTRKVLSDILRYSENKIEKLLQSNTIEIPT